MKKGWAGLFFNHFKDLIFILLGIFSAGFGLKSFLIPSGFIDGGVTGISLLISHLTILSISLLIFVINIPFIILGFKQIGKNFAIKTFLAIVGLSLCLAFIEYPIVTLDKLLVSVFGGFFLGLGIGLAVRGGCVIDGTEIFSLYLSKRIKTSMGTVLFFVNVIIFSVAAIFLGIEPALYSILIYLVASKTVDFIVNGIEEYIGLTIVSNKSKEIKSMLVTKLKKGVTIYKGKGGYQHLKEKEIIFTVVTRLEILRVTREVKKIDPDVFIVEESLNEVSGGFLKKRRL
ncbi:MAG: YitT family protein [Candidatus Pacearchaeota archaeon]|jgi:uncharacterized membrane-anchored protein YitT (DUF2179 family)